MYPVCGSCAARRGQEAQGAGLDSERVAAWRAKYDLATEGMTHNWTGCTFGSWSGCARLPVALDAATVTVLRTWRKAQVAERLAWGQAWTDSGRVFTRENGKA